MIRRLISSSFAGTSRNEVAVGTARLASMLRTIAAPAPRRTSPGTSTVPSAGDAGGAEPLGRRSDGGAPGRGAGAHGVDLGGVTGAAPSGQGLVDHAGGDVGVPLVVGEEVPPALAHRGSGSARYCSYISSTSQALGPRASVGFGESGIAVDATEASGRAGRQDWRGSGVNDASELVGAVERISRPARASRATGGLVPATSSRSCAPAFERVLQLVHGPTAGRWTRLRLRRRGLEPRLGWRAAEPLDQTRRRGPYRVDGAVEVVEPVTHPCLLDRPDRHETGGDGVELDRTRLSGRAAMNSRYAGTHGAGWRRGHDARAGGGPCGRCGATEGSR